MAAALTGAARRQRLLTGASGTPLTKPTSSTSTTRLPTTGKSTSATTVASEPATLPCCISPAIPGRTAALACSRSRRPTRPRRPRTTTASASMARSRSWAASTKWPSVTWTANRSSTPMHSTRKPGLTALPISTVTTATSPSRSGARGLTTATARPGRKGFTQPPA
ncbi:hypothetical protein D3C87_1268660 [compost metagenome]